MFYDYFDTGLIGTLTLVGDEEGLRYLNFPKEKRPVVLQAAWIHHPPFFIEIKAQLRAYFSGELKKFDLPLVPTGTTFQQKVWNALRGIPYGKLVSYRDIATAVGNPKAVRAVGGANARNPIPVVIPCHRVIGSNGTLTGFGGGLSVKKQLIELEQVNK